jgi:excisionase family DNA binding protein
VAVALDPGVRYILQAIKAGRLEAKKTGRQYLVTQEAVRKFWKSLPSAAQRRRTSP